MKDQTSPEPWQPFEFLLNRKVKSTLNNSKFFFSLVFAKTKQCPLKVTTNKNPPSRYHPSAESLIGECFTDEPIKGIGVLSRRASVIHEFRIRDVLKTAGFSIRSPSSKYAKILSVLGRYF